jgi:hypothetical protein
MPSPATRPPRTISEIPDLVGKFDFIEITPFPLVAGPEARLLLDATLLAPGIPSGVRDTDSTTEGRS